MTIEEFRSTLLDFIFDDSDVEEYVLTEEDWENIHELFKGALSELGLELWEVT